MDEPFKTTVTGSTTIKRAPGDQTVEITAIYQVDPPGGSRPCFCSTLLDPPKLEVDGHTISINNLTEAERDQVRWLIESELADKAVAAYREAQPEPSDGEKGEQHDCSD
jgi:hypothetical protein